MPTNQQIAVMFDIAKSGGADLNKERLPDVAALVASNYIEPIKDSVELYALTDKGQTLLDERGAGVNES